LTANRKQKIEFGDFQTPDNLAQAVCEKLLNFGISPNVIIEPTCGVGAFILAAASAFPASHEIYGFEINYAYLDTLREKLHGLKNRSKIKLVQADFFALDWNNILRACSGSILVLGNLPWVTNSTLGTIEGENLPEKSNFQSKADLMR
jgi:16S rRNA A1518/A1519 N6-dimethyltransferase RsmA/KsgA/DIM1 with predicted DNA glycosylase/AP lyase activity